MRIMMLSRRPPNADIHAILISMAPIKPALVSIN